MQINFTLNSCYEAPAYSKCVSFNYNPSKFSWAFLMTFREAKLRNIGLHIKHPNNILNPMKCHHVAECGELPYDTDPNYRIMLSRVELLDPTMARQQQNKEAQTKALK